MIVLLFHSGYTKDIAISIIFEFRSITVDVQNY